MAVQAAEATSLIKTLQKDLSAFKTLCIKNDEKFKESIDKSNIQITYFKEMFKNVSEKALEAESILQSQIFG